LPKVQDIFKVCDIQLQLKKKIKMLVFFKKEICIFCKKIFKRK